MTGRVCFCVLISALMLSIAPSIITTPAGSTEPILASWELTPRLLAQNKRAYPQGSIGKWPGGRKAPSLITTVVVVLMLAGAVAGFILYARKQKEAERRAAEKFRRDRSRAEDSREN